MDLDFRIPQLNRLIARIERFKQPNQVDLLFDETAIEIYLRGQAGLSLGILCNRLDYQVSSTTQVCRELSPYLSFVEELDMISSFPEALPTLQDDMDSTQWLELFRPFIAVQSLRVTKDLVPLVAHALQDFTGDRTSLAEVFPALCNLRLEGLEPSGLLWEAIQSFLTARQLSDCPVAIELGESDEGISEGELSKDDNARSGDGSRSEDEDDDLG